MLTPLTKVALNIVFTRKIAFPESNSKNEETADYNGITSQTCCIKLYKRMCVKPTISDNYSTPMCLKLV